MAFDNPTNHGRIAKAIQLLDLVQASANSNNTDASELADMLQPLVEWLPKHDTPQQISRPGMRTRCHHSDLMHLVQSEPLDQVLPALQLIASRIDAELYDRQTRAAP